MGSGSQPDRRQPQRGRSTGCFGDRKWHRFIAVWGRRYGDRAVSAGELLDLALQHGLLKGVLGDGGLRSRRIRLGRALGTASSDLRVTWDKKHKRKLYSLAPLMSRDAVNDTLVRPDRRQLCRDFLERLSQEVSQHPVVMPARGLLAWRDGEAVNAVRLVRWSWPKASEPDAPDVIRIGVNSHAEHVSRSVGRRLGLDAPSGCSCRVPIGHRALASLEYTVLGSQLIGLVPWLVGWIDISLRERGSVPPLHLDSYVWGRSVHNTRYMWTVPAWHGYARWKRTDEQLPYFAGLVRTGDHEPDPSSADGSHGVSPSAPSPAFAS